MSRVAVITVLGSVALLGCARHDRARPDEPEQPCAHWRFDKGECTGTAEVSAAPDPLLANVRFSYRWEGDGATETAPVQWEWWVPREQLDDLRANAPPRVACTRLVPTGVSARAGCKPSLWQPDAIKDPTIPFEARDRICPQSLPAPLNPDIVALDPAALAAALRPDSGKWHQTGSRPRPADGEAEAVYASDAKQARVVVRDMIHECTGEEATNTLLETEWRAGPIGSPRRVMSATSAVLVHPLSRGEWHPPRMVMWVAGRCRITVGHDKGREALSDDELVAVGQAVDVAALARLCSSRARGGS